MGTRERGMAQSQFAHDGWRQRGKQTMDGPAVNTDVEELDVQDEEAEAVPSALISTEAEAQDKETQTAAVSIPTRTR